MARGRRLAACASLLASAGAMAWLAVSDAPSAFAWRELAFGAGLAAASVGLTRKNIFAQIMSRGLTWVLFGPCAVVIFVELLKGRMFEPELTAFGLSTGLALFLARPMLHTEEARAQFAPSKFRRSFLAACTAAVTTGLVTGMVAWELLWSQSIAAGVGLAFLGMSMLASAFGVLRMRSWGIALATLNAIVSLVAGAFVGRSEGVALAATALPAALFLWPIVLAKLGVADSSSSSSSSASTSSYARIADQDALPARVRVASADGEESFDDAELVARESEHCEERVSNGLHARGFTLDADNA